MVARPGAQPLRQPSNLDFLTLIADITKEIRRPISITWVKGHQDEGKRKTPLSRDALNNIAVNALATRHRKEHRLAPRQHVPHLSSMKVSIQMNGLRLTGHFDSNLKHHINGYHLRNYIQERFLWTNSVWKLINHHLFGLHFRSLTPNHQV